MVPTGVNLSTDQLRAQIAEGRARLKSDPTDTDALQLIGRACMRLGHHADARGSYERALIIDPRDPWSHLYLGNLHYALEAYGEALREFQLAADLAPELSTPYRCIGDALGRLGRDAEAGAMYGRACDVDPECLESRRSLAAWLADRGDQGSDEA